MPLFLVLERNEGTLSLAGGSVGANGLIRAGWQATLNLGGNLAVAGTLNLDHESSLNLAGNTLDLSGGKIEMSGSHNLGRSDGLKPSAQITEPLRWGIWRWFKSRIPTITPAIMVPVLTWIT